MEIYRYLDELNELLQHQKEFNCVAALDQIREHVQEIVISHEQALLQLHQNKAMLDSIYNNIDTAIFVLDVLNEKEFVFAGLNPAHERLTGLTTAGVAGKKPGDFLPKDVANEVVGNYRRCVSARDVIEYEEQLTFDGRDTWWLTRLIPVFSDSEKIVTIIGASLRITELKKAVISADNAAITLQSIIDQIPVPVFFKDAALRYLGCNQAFEVFSGIHRSDLVGKTVFDISPANLAAEYNIMDLKLIEDGKQQIYRSQILNAEKVLRDVEFNKTVYYNKKGDLQGIIGTISDISDQLIRENFLKNEARHDPLTMLYNRRGFKEISAKGWSYASRHGLPFSILMIDVDNFKKYNDFFGHQAGDVCLQQVARSVQASLYRPDDLAARYGGEEFIISLLNVDCEGAFAVAERIRKAVEDLEMPHQTSLPYKKVTVSIGVASTVPERRIVMEKLIEEADSNLYLSKNNGKNRVSVSKYCLPVT